MPSANINIFKKYIKWYDEIKDYYEKNTIKDIEKYLSECNDIIELTEYYDSISLEIINVEKFIYDIKIVIDAIRLIDNEKYVDMMDNINEIYEEYKTQLSLIKSYISYN